MTAPRNVSRHCFTAIREESRGHASDAARRVNPSLSPALGEATTPAADDLRASVAGVSDLAILTAWDERLALGLASPADYAAAVSHLTARRTA